MKLLRSSKNKRVAIQVANKFEYFGKYILLEKLATGGMAEVFLARAPSAGGIGKFVAIKRILPQFADSPEFIDMFKDEAKIAINLNHSNIVSIHEFGVENEQFFLVMDYVEGRNLRQILNKMKKSGASFSIDQVIYMTKEIAAGLDHAHRCLDGTTGKPLNITHRDMSPQNVMVSFEGELKIVDFGIAKAESQIETTRAGTLKGKFGYMSPEQAEGHQVDLRTDIFSLGIVLWELLANDRLFISNNEINTLRKIRDCQIPSLRKLNPNIHSELERIATKALTKDRNLRYQTAAALHRDLNRFLNRQYPDFSPHDFAVSIKSLFSDEILSNRQRLIEYSKIPFKSLHEDNTENPMDKTIVTNSNYTQTNSYITESQDSNSHQEDNSPPVTQSQVSLTIDKPTSQDTITHSHQITPSIPPQGLNLNNPPAQNSDSSKTGSGTSSESSKQGFGVVISEAMLKGPSNAEPQTYIETEEPTDPIYQNKNTSITKSNYSTLYTPPPAARNSSSSLLSAMTFVIGFMTVYLFLAKHYTDALMPLIQVSTPILGPIYSHLGISGAVDKSSQSRQAPVVEDLPELQSSTTTPPSPSSQTEPSLYQQTNLIISSTPSGAEIYINGHNSGSVTPSRIQIPSTGVFDLVLKRTGYIDYEKKQIRASEIGSRLVATLQQARIGYLDIDARPPAHVRIYINGQRLQEGRLPISKYAVPADTDIVIRAENPINQSFDEQTIRVQRNQRSRVLLQLRPQQSERSPSHSQ